MADCPYILKVLNGPQFGAQLGICLESEYTIGSSDDCAIVLTDTNMAREHARLKVDGKGKLSIESLEGGISIDGKPITEPSTSLEACQVFTLGSTHLAIGPTEQVWPAIRLPRIRQIGAVPVKQVAVSDAGSGQKPKPFFRRPLVILAGCVVVLALITAIFFASEQPPSFASFRFPVRQQSGAPLDTAQKTVEEQLAAAIKKEVSSAEILSGFEKGRPKLTVYVQSAEEARQVRLIINQASEPVFSTIVSRDGIADALRVFLSGNQRETLKFSVTPPADVTWSGYLEKHDQWTQLEVLLKSDISSITRNINMITFGEDILAKVRELLRVDPLGSRVQATLSDDGIILEGALASKKQAEWTDVLAGAQKVAGKQTPLISKVTFEADPPSPALELDSPIAAVNLTGIPYVILANGRRLYPGSRLGKDLTLDNIEAHGLTFSGPRGDLTVPIFTSPIGKDAPVIGDL